MPATAAQSQVISGIRTSSQIFESNKVIETEEEADESSEEANDDEFDYYDYYDDYNDVTSEREEEQFRSEPAPAPPLWPLHALIVRLGLRNSRISTHFFAC